MSAYVIKTSITGKGRPITQTVLARNWRSAVKEARSHLMPGATLLSITKLVPVAGIEWTKTLQEKE